jgi:hypothetical protein
MIITDGWCNKAPCRSWTNGTYPSQLQYHRRAPLVSSATPAARSDERRNLKKKKKRRFNCVSNNFHQSTCCGARPPFDMTTAANSTIDQYVKTKSRNCQTEAPHVNIAGMNCFETRTSYAVWAFISSRSLEMQKNGCATTRHRTCQNRYSVTWRASRNGHTKIRGKKKKRFKLYSPQPWFASSAH